MFASKHTLDSCVPRAIFPLPPMRHQQQQAPYYQPAAAQAAARFGGAAEQGAGGGHAAEVREAGGKATRRKGRDMERALARGDLGALGSEVRTESTYRLLVRRLSFARGPTVGKKKILEVVNDGEKENYNPLHGCGLRCCCCCCCT